MHNFKITKHDAYVCIFSHNDNFIKFIKTKELHALTTNLLSYLQSIDLKLDDSSLINPDNTFNLNLDLKEEQLNKIIKLITVGAKNIPINLPESLHLSYELHKPLIYSHRPLSQFVGYWNLTQSEYYQIFQILSEDIIEVPYVDKPSDYEVRFDSVAFHTNHGTAHAIRLVTYFNQFLNLLKHHTEASITVEETNCLQLAMFLFRSGRTNELGWKDDSTYSPRSAFIFSTIALQLGYEPNLVEVISQCFDYKKSISLDRGFYTMTSKIKATQQALLYQTLFALCHTSDLVRCNPCYAALTEDMQNILNRYSTVYEKKEDLIRECLLFAAKCCKATGAAIMVPELKPADSKFDFGSPWVAVRSVANIESTFEKLESIAADAKDDILKSLKGSPEKIQLPCRMSPVPSPSKPMR